MAAEAKLTWPQFNKLYAKEHKLTFSQSLYTAGKAWKDYSAKFNERNPSVPGASKRKIIRKKPTNIPHKRTAVKKEREEATVVDVKEKSMNDDEDYDYIEERTVVKRKTARKNANPQKVPANVQQSDPPPKKKRKRSPSLSSEVHDSVIATMKSHPPTLKKKESVEEEEDAHVREEPAGEEEMVEEQEEGEESEDDGGGNEESY